LPSIIGQQWPMFGMSDFILYTIFSRKTKIVTSFFIFFCRELKKSVHTLSFKQPLLEFRLDPTMAEAGDEQKLLILRRD